MKENFPKEKSEMEFVEGAGLKEQLENLEDRLFNLKEEGEISLEQLKRFRTSRSFIDSIGDEKAKNFERRALLKEYRNLIRSHE